MADSQTTRQWQNGDRVLWGRAGKHMEGTLLGPSIDRDSGERLTCGDEDCNKPLWCIHFADGVTREYCCEASIVTWLPPHVFWDHPIYTEPTDTPGLIRCWQVGRPSWLEVDWDAKRDRENQK